MNNPYPFSDYVESCCSNHITPMFSKRDWESFHPKKQGAIIAAIEGNKMRDVAKENHGSAVEANATSNDQIIAQEGLKFDDGKIRYDLLPVDALDEISKVLTFGAKKYADRNWEKGMRWGRLYRAALGHLFSWWKGEEADPETGLSHLAHAACCCIFLLSYQLRNGKIHSETGNNPVEDDRP